MSTDMATEMTETGMDVVDAFTESKHPDRLNEDTLVVTADYAAVIDGATDKSGIPYALDGQQVTAARFAAQIVAAAVADLPAAATAREAVAQISRVLNEAILAQQPDVGRHDRPACALLVYSRARHEVWRVADCSWAFDGVERRGKMKIDDITSHLRGQVIEAHLDDGWTVDDLRAADPGRAAIQGLLTYQAMFANRVHDLGYGVINGTEVPDVYIEATALDGPGVLTLASDGYPRVLDTRAASEALLDDLIAADPLCIGALIGPRALIPGARAYDDRTWLQLRVGQRSCTTPSTTA